MSLGHDMSPTDFSARIFAVYAKTGMRNGIMPVS